MVRRNLTWGDATFRGLLGLVLVIASMDTIIILDGSTRLWAAGVLAVLAAAMVFTAFTGFCPIYRAFGRRTAPEPRGWGE